MTWVRLADDFADHPKVISAGPLAGWLWVCSLAYANKYLTDGFIPQGAVRRLADVDDPAAQAALLVRAGLWEPCQGGYRIHDYAKYQPSAEHVKVERAVNARRQELYRSPELTRAVRDRDGDVCRYCGIVVVWKDRRGPAGGTYDHVDPTGINALENLVVCCRACNASKGSRTPAAAGMVLRPVAGRFPVDKKQVRAGPGKNGSSDSGLPGPGPYPVPAVNPVPAVVGTSPQPPPQAEGEWHKGGTNLSADLPTLAPLTDDDAALWAAAKAAATDGLLPANAERIEILEPLGRAPNGGLYLRAPPGWSDARMSLGAVRAALVHVGDAAGKHAAIVTG